MFVGLLLKVGSLDDETSSTLMWLVTVLNAVVVIVPIIEVFLMIRDSVLGTSPTVCAPLFSSADCAARPSYTYRTYRIA